MSSSGFSPSLAIDRAGCRRVQALVLVAILLALAALAHGGLPPWLQAAAIFLVVGGGLRELRRVSPRAPRYVARIIVAADGQFLLGLTGEPGTLLPATVMNTWTLPGLAIGMAFTGSDDSRVAVILFRDRTPADAWRRLAVRLRHGGWQEADHQ